MDTESVMLQVPSSLYRQLQTLAIDANASPIEVISQLVTTAHQRRQWRQDLHTLRQQIQESGGLLSKPSQESMTEQLRQTRQEIFEAEYAHLYR